MKKFRVMVPDWFLDVEAETEEQAEAQAIERLCKELREKKAGLLVYEVA